MVAGKHLLSQEVVLVLPWTLHNCFPTQIGPISTSPRQVESGQFRVLVQIPLADHLRDSATSFEWFTANLCFPILIFVGAFGWFPRVQYRQKSVEIVFSIAAWLLKKALLSPFFRGW